MVSLPSSSYIFNGGIPFGQHFQPTVNPTMRNYMLLSISCPCQANRNKSNCFLRWSIFSVSCSWLEYRLWKWCKTWSTCKVKHKRLHLWSLSGCSTFWCSKKYNNSNTTLPTNLLFVLLFSLFVLLFSVVLCQLCLHQVRARIFLG